LELAVMGGWLRAAGADFTVRGQPLKRAAFYLVAAVTIAGLYYWAILQALGFVTVRILTPDFVHGAKSLGGLPFLKLSYYAIDVVLTLLVSFPFALLIARIFPTKWLGVALFAGVCTSVPDLVAIPVIWRYNIDHLRYATDIAISTLRLLVTLPVLTYLAHRLTSKNRWRGP
jgi:hypothetical protein